MEEQGFEMWVITSEWHSNSFILFIVGLSIAEYHSQTDQFSHQQMSLFSGHENPMWVDPFPAYVDYAESS